jgi:hypothetical protein
MERARMLFGCYRRGDANDPETYVAAISAVLSLYEADLIREVTDPRTGIQTTEKHMTFMPQSGELKVYCDGIAARKQRMQHLGSLAKPERARLMPPEPRSGDRATVHVPTSHERYAKLVEWSKSADMRLWRFGKSSDGRDGIWIPWDVWDNAPAPAPRIGEFAKSFTLSPQAVKTMVDLDAERNGELPADQARSEVA